MIQKDNDPVHGLGFVTLYGAYLEEQIDILLYMLRPVQEFTDKHQKQPISQRIAMAQKAVSAFDFETRDELLKHLDLALKAFQDRNEVVHGRIYAGGHDRPDILKSGRPNIPDREVTPDELYDLANYLSDLRLAIARPMLFKIPRALNRSG